MITSKVTKTYEALVTPRDAMPDVALHLFRLKVKMWNDLDDSIHVTIDVILDPGVTGLPTKEYRLMGGILHKAKEYGQSLQTLLGSVEGLDAALQDGANILRQG